MPLPGNERTVYEGATGVYQATLRDHDGVALALSQITALTLTVLDGDTNQVINSRNAQDVLNANNVTVHATSGLLTWYIQPEDTAMVGTDPSKTKETRKFTFTWTYTSGARTYVGKEPDYFLVVNQTDL